MIFCSLYSGSTGNSIFVSSNNTKLLIDAGLSGKNIDKALNEIGECSKDIDAILVTHEHTDHIKGVGVLSRKYDIPIYANIPTWEAMSSSIGKLKNKNIKIINSRELSIKDVDIINYKIPHDAASPLGYAICHKNKKACIATDLGFFTKEIKDVAKDADVVLLESNHDIEMLKFGPYPYNLKRRILSNVGHLSNEDCGKAILNILSSKPKKIVLGHLSKTNNYPKLAYQTVINILKEKDVTNKDIILSMAKRTTPSNYIKF
ncbi:putative metallo-hydrolase YycJ [Clostridium acetireducens DSM 10703]|jgi:phosphoribosyl 1,2-cyclic phosphodiesterase|uniref:Putative metallo-hydrolase YycJ n=1 Tax=Clostridium acetireducens DSM 10703 TaxID=1121290 RepID=A0A1E8EZN9_9CLOT|nr:MBL fold metallo-hydrolase [Clostridium acetireducens]OFI06598.1 putative metallo-hydrolase YycJ [Clostridium acetireducens DSM 10703]